MRAVRLKRISESPYALLNHRKPQPSISQARLRRTEHLLLLRIAHHAANDPHAVRVLNRAPLEPVPGDPE